MYKTGDKVVHPGHGGCTVEGTCKRTIGGENIQYFVLVPQTDPGTTILAPVENVEKIGLREVISAEKADQLLSYFSAVEVDWVSDQNKRRQAYEATLRDGEPSSLAKMIKELTVHEAHAKLSTGDKEMLPRAQKKLFSEIALAKGIAFESALHLAQESIS